MKVREPVAAGTFYEANPKLLEKEIKDCFKLKKGPGALPISKREGFVYGAIVPHAGYTYSGYSAAWAYKALGEAEPADTYIILGPNHSGLGGSSLTTQNFSTPLGIVRTDKALANYLVKKEVIVDSELPHLEEHSVEVQIPFLQFINRNFDSWKILPIVLSNDIDYKKLALAIKEAMVDLKKRITVIASSDFTHYGHAYGYIPFSSDIPDRIRKLDEGAIEFIKKLDDEGFLNYVYETGATICGALPIAVLLRLMAHRKPELLQYYTSADLIGDYKNSVSYVSMIFK